MYSVHTHGQDKGLREIKLTYKRITIWNGTERDSIIQRPHSDEMKFNSGSHPDAERLNAPFVGFHPSLESKAHLKVSQTQSCWGE